jgi:hypothetical protein
MKKILITSITLASIAASPAFAQDRTHRTGQPMTNASEYFGTYPNGYVANDPNAVVSGDRVVGRDPDANVRLQILRDAAVSQN